MIAAVSASLLVGIACIWLSPLWTILGLVVTAFVYVVVKRPELALLVILIATSSIVFEDQLPLLTLGGISLHIPDFLLFGTLAIIAIRWLVEPGFKIMHTPLDGPLLLFCGLTLLSTFIAISKSSLDIVEARRMIRYMSYYLTFFIVTNLVRDRSQLNLLINGIFLLATVVAVAMIVQYISGVSLPFLPGRVETLNTQGTPYEDVSRILPPGWSIIMVSAVAISCILAQEKFRAQAFLRFLQLGLLGTAIVFTFIRAYWAALIFVLFLATYLVRGRQRQRLFAWWIVVFVLLVTIVLYGLGEPKSQVGKLVGATYSRLGTLWSANTLNGPRYSGGMLKINMPLPLFSRIHY